MKDISAINSEIKATFTSGMAGWFFIDTYNGGFFTKIVKLQSKLWLKKYKIYDVIKDQSMSYWGNVNHCGLWHYRDEIILNHMTTSGLLIHTLEEYLSQLVRDGFHGKIMIFGVSHLGLYDYLNSCKLEYKKYDYIGAFLAGIKSLVCKQEHRPFLGVTPQELHFITLKYIFGFGGTYSEITIDKESIKSEIHPLDFQPQSNFLNQNHIF